MDLRARPELRDRQAPQALQAPQGRWEPPERLDLKDQSARRVHRDRRAILAHKDLRELPGRPVQQDFRALKGNLGLKVQQVRRDPQGL